MKHLSMVSRKPAYAKDDPPIDVQFLIDLMKALVLKKSGLLS